MRCGGAIARGGGVSGPVASQPVARQLDRSINRILDMAQASARQCINGAPRTKGFMKYRRQFHAGNFADVHKHVLLLEVLEALTRKDKGLLFVDTHAGRGLYDLHPGDAQHPAEWQSGVAKLLASTPSHPALQRYRERVVGGQHGASLHYPGSPLLALRELRAADRAVFFETQR